MNALLDTNAAIELLSRGTDAEFPGIEPLLCWTVLGELYYGAFNSARVDENLKRFEALRDSFPIIDCDDDTALIYGTVKADLRRRGVPIPDNDAWIAAHAIRHDFPLLTRDRHFDGIEALKVVRF